MNDLVAEVHNEKVLLNNIDLPTGTPLFFKFT